MQDDQLKPAVPATKPAASQGNTPLLRLDTAKIFANNDEIIIDHAGQSYRLRITRSGKLILTK